MTGPNRHPFRRLTHALALAAALLGAAAAQAQQTVTVQSHWPDEAFKRGVVEGHVKAFEAAMPSCKVNQQFIQKADLYTVAQTAVRTGRAPDIFWLERAEIAFAKSGYLEPLDAHVDVTNPEDWARRSWCVGGKIYGLPLQASTVALYVNRDVCTSNAPATCASATSVACTRSTTICT